MPDTGDPRRAAPIWVGTYQMSVEGGVTLGNEWVMLSKQNMVQFMGDADGVTSNQTFATLPKECRPDEAIMIPVVVEGTDGSEQTIGILTVSPNGELSCNLSGKVHLNGLNFHTCCNYY